MDLLLCGYYYIYYIYTLRLDQMILIISHELSLSSSQCENEVMAGRIISSVAKMNEYYLNKADFEERRFTMCHEIGQ